MTLETAATGIGKQVVTHAVRTWLGRKDGRIVSSASAGYCYSSMVWTN